MLLSEAKVNEFLEDGAKNWRSVEDLTDFSGLTGKSGCTAGGDGDHRSTESCGAAKGVDRLCIR